MYVATISSNEKTEKQSPQPATGVESARQLTPKLCTNESAAKTTSYTSDTESSSTTRISDGQMKSKESVQN